MSVSQRDRSFMDRIGRYKRRSRAAMLKSHRALSVSARLDQSWKLYLGGRGTASVSNRVDDPSPFYALARSLGLYNKR